MSGRHLQREVLACLVLWAALVAALDVMQGRTVAVLVAAVPVTAVVGAVRIGRYCVAAWAGYGLALVLLAGRQLVAGIVTKARRLDHAAQAVRVEVTATDLPAPRRQIEGRLPVLGGGPR